MSVGSFQNNGDLFSLEYDLAIDLRRNHSAQRTHSVGAEHLSAIISANKPYLSIPRVK